MEDVSFRRFAWALAAFAALQGAGTLGYHSLTREGWVSSLYRSVVTTTPGTSPSSTSWSMRANVIVNS